MTESDKKVTISRVVGEFLTGGRVND